MVGVLSPSYDRGQREEQSPVVKLMAVLPTLSWRDAFGNTWSIMRRMMECWSRKVMHEVLEHESTPELKDRGECQL
jgi:hypothetical protein